MLQKLVGIKNNAYLCSVKIRNKSPPKKIKIMKYETLIKRIEAHLYYKNGSLRRNSEYTLKLLANPRYLCQPLYWRYANKHANLCGRDILSAIERDLKLLGVDYERVFPTQYIKDEGIRLSLGGRRQVSDYAKRVKGGN